MTKSSNRNFTPGMMAALLDFVFFDYFKYVDNQDRLLWCSWLEQFSGDNITLFVVNFDTLSYSTTKY